ncbi:MAG: YSC84-related protein [Halieaceae bacterium]
MMRLLILLLALTVSLNPAQAASRAVIDARVADAMQTFRKESPAAAELMDEAAGVLVFPEILKVGFGIGAEYGEGALLVDGKSTAYYSTSGGSFGLQMGAQSRAGIILFMKPSALRKFRRSKGWEAGVDGSVAFVKEGLGGSIDTSTAKAPIIGFVFSNKGLMYNLTLEGSKITPIDR